MARCYITFRNTYEAMRYWTAARESGVSGGLGPAPRNLQASCATAWITEPELLERAVEVAGMYRVQIAQAVIQ